MTSILLAAGSSNDNLVIQAPVVRRLDNAIHWINRYTVEKF